MLKVAKGNIRLINEKKEKNLIDLLNGLVMTCDVTALVPAQEYSTFLCMGKSSSFVIHSFPSFFACLSVLFFFLKLLFFFLSFFLFKSFFFFLL